MFTFSFLLPRTIFLIWSGGKDGFVSCTVRRRPARKKERHIAGYGLTLLMRDKMARRSDAVRIENAVHSSIILQEAKRIPAINENRTGMTGRAFIASTPHSPEKC